ncbi:hypothetical protein MtrunA17_Chr1g0213681 [Medicago truncatula]|uniref:Uncharacterized protein n=1 Tax=Medicago truncatula TaxID=3880 RepID=A0A396JZC5_MEDTR|nr:hypothetical protein MtrunA17_Chr1g0213681 [Medicago truncatula]
MTFKGTAFLKVIPIPSVMSISSGLRPSDKIQSKELRREPRASGSTREASGNAGHILRPEPKVSNHARVHGHVRNQKRKRWVKSQRLLDNCFEKLRHRPF